MRGNWIPNRTAAYWPPLLWSSAFSLSRFPDAQPEARGLSFLLAFSTTSCHQLIWSLTQWLPVITELYNSSIAHSISILMASQAGICHFRRLWISMFDHHQAEITVMQFRGHSLPVNQSMSVPWDFTLSHFVSQPAYAISSHNCHRNVSLPSGASLWNGMFGRVEGQYTTEVLLMIKYFYRHQFILIIIYTLKSAAQLAGAIEYSDCISVEEQDPTQRVSLIWH